MPAAEVQTQGGEVQGLCLEIDFGLTYRPTTSSSNDTHPLVIYSIHYTCRINMYIIQTSVCGDLWPLSLLIPLYGPPSGGHVTLVPTGLPAIRPSRAPSPRYPHSLTTWVSISVLKTRNKGAFEQSLNVCEFGKKGCFYSLEFAELRIRGGFPH